VQDDKTIIRRPPRPAEQPKEMKAYLIVLSGTLVGKMFELSGSQLVIGRATDADIRLDDDGVSRMHARMDCASGGEITLVDLESTNGTFVNGSQIRSQALRDGDRIQIGSVTVLKFSYQDSLEEQFQQQLYESATRDALTQAYNKRFFTDQLAIDYTHAIRHGLPLSLLMFDIDFFKKVNDTYGHDAGDAVLRTLATAVMDSIRNEDVYCRVGGEEFAVIMRDCDQKSAMVLGERLRALVEKTPISHGDRTLNVTISVGVATLDTTRHKRGEQLTAEADKYLYDAKRSGRNRVCGPDSM
jgi:diguanylate cyclase (GGDEF)-like protein